MAGPGASPELVQRMADDLRHRGPDGSGLWNADGVALGHRRLKIIDLSEAGCQPMSTPDGRFTIIYNGEVYNYLELRKTLPEVRFQSDADTEVVLHAYARWGTECLRLFTGMFAFAIWDKQERALFVARDRLGIKPLYFTHMDGAFLFASEIGALLEAGAPRALNERVLYDFLARDFYEHTHETFFEGIEKLPAAHWMVVRDGQIVQQQRYWQLADHVARLAAPAAAEDRQDRLLELCRRAVALHLRSDVPVGVALSGGLDSATLLALLDQVHPDPVRVEAFSFGFEEAAYSELHYVAAMAEATGRASHATVITPADFAHHAERDAVIQEEPFAGLPISAYAACFRQARAHGFIVMMDGSGVDEALAGYDRFRPALWRDLRASGDEDGLAAELDAVTGGDPARLSVIRQQLDAPAGVRDVGLAQDLTRSVRPECLAPELAARAAGPMPSFASPFPDELRSLMYRELTFTKLPRALRFRDRLSMAVGAELRPPFLDHDLLAFAFALPWHDRIFRGETKVILRRAASRLLPDLVRLAAKRSVQTPQREWFRGPLREWVRERVDTSRFWQRGWVEPRAGKAAMEAFFAGDGDNSFFLWQWVNLELWAAHFLDR